MIFFVCAVLMLCAQVYVSDVTLKSLPDHDGNRTRDLWDTIKLMKLRQRICAR
jgi:hypothetical protein